MKTQITRWNPLKELDDLQSRLAGAWGFAPASRSGQEEKLIAVDWASRVDISEDKNEFLINAELPELRKEDVKVTVEDGVLTISGERKLEREEKNKKYHRIEREYGSFGRSFTLPAGTSGKKAAADFKDGILRVHLPKDAKAPASKAIEIKVG